MFRRRGSIARSYRPEICILEDRTLPSGFRVLGSSSGPAPPVQTIGYRVVTGGTATALEVVAPKQVTAGKSFSVEVEAVDSDGRVSAGFTGTVQLSLANADAGATLPSYTFTTADRGIHDFTVTLTTAESQAIYARDTAAGSTIAGGALTTVASGPVARFDLTAPSMAATGVATPVAIEAVDAYGNVVAGFTGAVRLSATNASLPASVTFVAADHGKDEFNVDFLSAGAQTVSATAATNAAITGSASVTAYAANQATHFAVTVLGQAMVGMPTEVQITALNAGNQVDTAYTGTIQLTSSDNFASGLGNYTFTAQDQGTYMCSVVFATPGTQTITATDTMTSSITGTATTSVAAPAYPNYGGYYGAGYYGAGYYGPLGYGANSYLPGYYGTGYYGTGYFGQTGYGTGYYGLPAYYGIAGNSNTATTATAPAWY